MRRRREAGRERENVERALMVITGEQPVHWFLCVVFLLFTFFQFYFAALVYFDLGLLCS